MNGRNEPVDMQAMLKALQDLPRLTEQIRDQMYQASEQQMAAAIQADVEAAMPDLDRALTGAMGTDQAVQAHHGTATVRMAGDGSTVTVALAVRRLTAATIDRCAADTSVALTTALHRQAKARQAYYAGVIAENRPAEDDEVVSELEEHSVELGQQAGAALATVTGTATDPSGTATVAVTGGGSVRVELAPQARRYRTPQEVAGCIEQGYAAAVAAMADQVEAALDTVSTAAEQPPAE